MRLVLDTNVVVSAALGSSAPARLIELATEGEIELITSAGLLAELAGVLEREHIARRLAHRHRSGSELIALYADIVEVALPASITPTAPDPDDDAVLACALAAGADLIVSGRKLPRQVDRSEVEVVFDSISARKTAGGCLPSASCGLSSL